PGDRDNARAVFSGTQGAVYLVGGHDLGGVNTGEVWRYDLASDEWIPLALNTADHPRPRDIRAITYDDRRQQVLVIDEGSPVRPGNGTPPNDPNATAARLLKIDAQTGIATVSVTIPRAGKFTKIGLATQEDGSFI